MSYLGDALRMFLAKVADRPEGAKAAMAKNKAYQLAEQKIADALRSGDPLSFSPKSDDLYLESAYILFIVVFGGDARQGRGG